ncbi:MAG: AI-2E family transporter [Thermoanaerobaculia bacterium]|nr:AI-2E family transporter [Thermoanaerobaculia bacterium]
MSMNTDPGANAVQSAFKRSWLPLVGFFAIAIVIAVLTIRVFLPFVTPILLAGILVSFTYPTYERVRARLGGRSGLAAATMLLALTLVVVIPVGVLVAMLVQQASGVVEALQETDVQQKIDSLQLESRLDSILSRIPGVDAKKVSVGSLAYAAVKNVSGFVAAQGGHIFGSLLDLVVGFFMMLLAATWFYTDGKQLVVQLEELSPLRRNQTREIFVKVRGVIDATLRGQVLTALAQGAVTGIGCAITGVPGAFLWGAVAAITSLIPMVGASLVWIPAAGYLAFTGGLDWRVFFLLLWGVLVVGTIDNLIRPWAMKGGTAMSGIVLIFSILGGMKVFGIIGLLMGPLTLVLFVTVVGFYREMFLDDIEAAEQ